MLEEKYTIIGSKVKKSFENNNINENSKDEKKISDQFKNNQNDQFGRDSYAQFERQPFDQFKSKQNEQFERDSYD